MLSPILVVALLSAGLPASFVRLWWIWWQSTCGDCGLERRVCECPPDGPVMRPRR
ncbi:MAG TPA: hypothetical protein VFB35_02890 [Gaiellaceae bacterium]|nr:hypothetical protein [Gaiellaceae bacterium]